MITNDKHPVCQFLALSCTQQAQNLILYTLRSFSILLFINPYTPAKMQKRFLKTPRNTQDPLSQSFQNQAIHQSTPIPVQKIKNAL